MQEQPQEALRSLSNDEDRTSISCPHHRHVKREPSHRFSNKIALISKINFLYTLILLKQISRIFVNRSLLLSTIKYFGFDMDYTLAGLNLIASF